MIQDILEELGYELRDGGSYYRMLPLYRASSNPSSLSVHKETGRFRDFSAGIYGSIEELVKLTLGLKTLEDANRWLDNRHLATTNDKIHKPNITVMKTYPKDMLSNLFPNFKFYTDKGVHEDVLHFLKCGMSTTGKLRNRIVFPIFHDDGSIVGWAGRDITGESDAKWKLMGPKRQWNYPAFFTSSEILETRKAILVESIGDGIALLNKGVNNFLVLFGVDLLKGVMSKLIELNPQKIIISLNNDSKKELNSGKIASQLIKEKLDNFFDDVEINLPTDGKDIFEMDDSEFRDWYEKV